MKTTRLPTREGSKPLVYASGMIDRPPGGASGVGKWLKQHAPPPSPGLGGLVPAKWPPRPSSGHSDPQNSFYITYSEWDSHLDTLGAWQSDEEGALFPQAQVLRGF